MVILCLSLEPKLITLNQPCSWTNHFTVITAGAPKIEVKVVYRDSEGNIKVSDADGDTPVLQDTILQLIVSQL